MKGLVFDPEAGTLICYNGARRALAAANVMISLLPTVRSFTGRTVTFPDPPKGNLYLWGASARLSFSTLGKRESASSYVTAKPQEYSFVQVLADAPEGADFFIGHLTLNRTSSPSHTWRSATLAVLPAANQWLPISGAFSALMEAEVGLSRAMHVYIDDIPLSPTYRKLVLETEQSVGPPSGGYTVQQNAASPTSWRSAVQAVNGADNADVAENGIPILFLGGASYGPENSTFTDTTIPASALPTRLRHNGSHPSKPTRVDPTDYQSVYSVDLRGRFGRRS